MILTESQVNELTKPIKQRAAQRRHLERLFGVELKTRADGLPIVPTALVDHLYTTTASNDSEPSGINWSKRA